MTRVVSLAISDTLSLRRIVRQAQDRDVGGVQELGARGRILAALGRHRDDLDVVAAGQPRS